MLELTREHVVEFFGTRIKQHPEVRQPSNHFKHVYGEDSRADVFTRAQLNIKEKRVVFSDRLTSTIYHVSEPYKWGATLALYQDGTLLWLDDHSSNTDFELFLQRESFDEQLENPTESLLVFLLQTKFGFLGGFMDRLLLIRDITDIPIVPEKHRHEWPGSYMYETSQERLPQIADQIFPPVFEEINESKVRVKFVTWAEQFGNVYSVEAFISTDDSFEYMGEQLTDSVGDYFHPRFP